MLITIQLYILQISIFITLVNFKNKRTAYSDKKNHPYPILIRFFYEQNNIWL